MSITSEAKQEVARLLTEGQKNEAITYLQETFQISLIDAKALVDVVERNLNIAPELNMPGDTVTAEVTATPVNSSTSESSSTVWGPLKEDVKTLILSGKKIEAVKLVRLHFRKGLKEALEMVEEVQKEIDPSLIPASSKSGCAGNVFKIVSILFAIVAFVLIAMAVLGWWGIQDQVNQSERVRGRVITMKADNTDGTTAPVISYEWQGSSREYISTFYSNPPEYAINDEVFIYVNRENPDNVMIDSFTDRWLGFVIIGGLGLFFTFFTVLLGFAARKF